MPAYFYDAYVNGLCFNVRQALIPQTSAWPASSARRTANLKNACALLSGTVGASLRAREHGQIALKTADDRSNRHMVVKHPAKAERHA